MGGMSKVNPALRRIFFRAIAGPSTPTNDPTKGSMSDSVLSIFERPDMAPEEVAARLLMTASALDDLTLADAFKVVAYMRPKRIAPGTVFIREGEVKQNDHMLLVLEGDIAVESELSGLHETMVVSVMGPGNLIGEMGALDGSPRSATCTAITEIYAAVLSRAALMRLLKEDPRVGARLLLAISKRMADRLRDTNRKLLIFAQMNKTLQQELQVVMNSRTPPDLR
jgi:CRP-like cAMP-binding protein